MQRLLPNELISEIVSRVEDTSPWYFVSKQCAMIAKSSNTVGLKEACRLGRWIEVRSRMKSRRNKEIAIYNIYKYEQKKLYQLYRPYENTREFHEPRARGIIRSGNVALYKELNILSCESDNILKAYKSRNTEMLSIILPICSFVEAYTYETIFTDAVKILCKEEGEDDKQYATMLAEIHNVFIRDKDFRLAKSTMRGIILSGNVKKLKGFISSNSIFMDDTAYLELACESGKLDMIRFILDELRKKFAGITYGPYIYNACISKKVEIVKYILDLAINNGEEIILYCDDVETMCESGKMEIIDLLEKYMENKWHYGLYTAVEADNTEMAMRILANMKYVDQENDDMVKILGLAIENKNRVIAYKLTDFMLNG
jgi:hypothetical protein